MKKGLLGCLLVGVVLILAGTGAAYWFVLRPMLGEGTQLAEAPRDWAGVIESEQAIRNQSPFAAPSEPRLTQEQVNRFVAVNSNLLLRLGVEFETLQRAYETAAAAQGAGKAPDVTALVAADPKLGELLARLRQAQVEGLNRQNLSLAEYRWIRDQVYTALPFLDLDPDAIVAPKPPPGAMVDAATGEIIRIEEDPVDAMAADAAAVAREVAGTVEGEDGLEYAGTAPEEEELLPGLPVDPAEPRPEPPKPQLPDGVAETVKDRGLGDDSELDTLETQAARANGVLLRPHKDLILRTLGGSWMGL
jgi:hypothetical protein